MFLENKKIRSEKTAKVYSGIFFNFLELKPLSKITYSDLLDYVAYLEKPNPMRNPIALATSTQNSKIAAVKSLFKYAMKTGYIKINPSEPISTKHIDSKVSRRLLATDELEALLSAAVNAGTLQTVIVYFFAVTGCRVSELVNIMWADFFIRSG